ncbi:bifunctional enoyl-CoA hydratase/phosphate acetyltransferase [Pokkaliibacter sp. CJK22405]|uniref:bifunctional enoyl-CoA hydratase/phosphate acetyltransferase n=1 Tax=Pokkaliibacter sp. CJK22405 TaxID=3384615 RepID=UPI003984C74F
MTVDIGRVPRQGQLAYFIEQACHTAPMPTAIVHPVDPNSLQAACEAHERGLISAILVGPEARIRDTAKTLELPIDTLRIVDTEHSHAAAAKACALVHAGEARALMKGGLSTDEFLGAILHREYGIRTDRRLSHLFIFDVPSYPKPLFLSDAAINIQPDLEIKKDIVQNAIDFCRSLGISQPKVAILAAVEKVNPKMQSTLDAAALCKMAERGQIQGGLLDGPLALDNAISREAAEDKHIHSAVAGDVDILIAPDLEAANMLGKQLIYLAGAQSAGVVLGARVPLILTSRAEKTQGRLASCALASLFMQAEQ